MERVGTLINNLKDLFDQQAEIGQLSEFAQLLLDEIQSIKLQQSIAESLSEQAAPDANHAQIPARQEVLNAENASIWSNQSNYQSFSQFLHQKFAVDELLPVNDTLVVNQSLNDALKEETVEVAEKLVDTPIEDLRKAISINDRYLFISMLFMGDENNFDRSIRTINSFNMLAEAQYWIQRELKVKMGWQDENGTVKHFYSLVRRRFARI
jgi:hypothetical protein